MFRIAAPALLLAILPVAALAHAEGHGSASFLAGLAHPVGGADHLLAMIAVGLWALQAGRRALWLAPAAFVAGLLAGGALGLAGVALPAVEPMILASVMLLGAAVALAVRPPLAVALAALAAFGVAHGWAHGAEGPATGLAAYAAGFALASAGLHAAGIGLGLALARGLRIAGGATALAGLALVLAN
jgi:urease accessory protein